MNPKFLKFAGVVICALLLGFVTSSLLHKSPATSPKVTSTQNQTDASSMNTTTPSNSPADNSTPSGGGAASTQTAVGSSQQAESIVTGIYAKKIANDANLKVKYDHMDNSNGQQVYVVHVFDQQSGHDATIAWVDVRQDGLVQNELLRNGWVHPNEYQP